MKISTENEKQLQLIIGFVDRAEAGSSVVPESYPVTNIPVFLPQTVSHLYQ